MPKDDGFKEFIIDQLAQLNGLVCRSMFGGFGLYQVDRFFGIVHKNRLYFKTGPSNVSGYLGHGMKPFCPNSKQTLKSYYEVPPDIIDDAPRLADWATAAVVAANEPPDTRPRCDWAKEGIMRDYHDSEWGVPMHDDRKLFEFLVLEGAQAGLSWEIVLKKREGYRKAFAGFDARKVSKFTPARVRKLLGNPGIIRNRLKIESTIRNADAFLAVQKEFGSFDAYIWSFVNGRPHINRFRSLKELPAKTDLSDAISADLKKRGFSFIGSTVIYAHMQATGMVNDHQTKCFRWREVLTLNDDEKRSIKAIPLI